jgi:hypothetical protein
MEQRRMELHAEIERTKDLLLVTTDELGRRRLHARINACLRENIALIDQRLQSQLANRPLTLQERWEAT